MIPKTLIYCNFGHFRYRDEIEVPCMKSWEKYFPKSEWTWIELNEETFDVNAYPYTKLAYEKKMFAFVSDFARVWYLANFGGVYVDTDFMMIRPFDENLLKHECFFGSCINEEIKDEEMISWGIFGTNPGARLICDISQEFYKMEKPCKFMMYETARQLAKRGFTVELLSNHRTSAVTRDGVTIYPFEKMTGCFWTNDKIRINDTTMGVHLFAGSWTDKANKIRSLKRIEGFGLEKYL